MIRLLIADDHEMVRSSLALGLELDEGIEVVGQAGDGTEAVELCETLLPDVVLMDLRMPKMDGLTATRLILESHPDIRVVVLTNTADRSLVNQIIGAGASRCLLKNATLDQLCRAVTDTF